MELAVRGGGHSLAGHSTVDGGIVLDLAGMKGLHIDPRASTRLGPARPDAPGSTPSRRRRMASRPRSATPASVGIAGLTLGGGIGWLARKHGLAIDALESVEIVTADGRLITANATEHPDLFWAVRGGGGNFGVVTRFQYQLYPVGTHPRWRAVHAADDGRAAQPRADRGERARGAHDDLVPDGRAAGAVRPGRDPRRADTRRHVRVRRRPGRRARGPGPVPRRSRRRSPKRSCRCRTRASTRCSEACRGAAVAASIRSLFL